MSWLPGPLGSRPRHSQSAVIVWTVVATWELVRATLRWWRGPFGVITRQCLRAVAAPTLLATCAALVAATLGRPELARGQEAAAAATPWLTLPLFVAALGCCLVAAQQWPTYTRRRPGADAVRRIARGPLGGRAAVVAGALCAQLALTLPVAIALTAWLGAPDVARLHRPCEGPRTPILERQGASLEFRLSSPERAHAVRLRPQASLPTGPDATRVALTAEGEALHDAPIEFDESLELMEVPVDGRALTGVRLTRVSGDVPLLFDAGSVVVVSADERPRWANAALLALLGAACSGATLALAALLGAAAGLPTVASAIAAVQFVLWVGGVGPLAASILAVLRGQWLF